MKKNLLIAGGVVVGLVILYFAIGSTQSDERGDILVQANKGLFQINVTTTGELEAKNSVKIMGPTGLRSFRIWNVNIQKIIEEGTVVKKGDFVASLDPSELVNKMKDGETTLEQENSKYIQTQLDTTLQMREARDELVNLKYGVEEKEIKLDQSQYEPPATIKQAEIDLDKAKRAYEQATENYKIKHLQNIAKMREVAALLTKAQRELEAMNTLMAKFTITAPEDGMLIYRKGWDGKPIKEGSQVSAWDPVVATLPDLSVMMSRTYVNEVDVRKIKAGQLVEIGLDAFPEKRLKGEVINVANVGEQRPNSDAKVFQVNVQVHGTDALLRPAMTTSNSIIALSMIDAIFIPLECLHNEGDTITYVYKKEGLKTVKQEVQVGETNTDEAVIIAGINELDKIHLSIPSGMDSKQIALIPEMDGKRSQPEPDPAEEIQADESVSAKGGKKGERGGKREHKVATTN